jgi:hypothetical protein
VRAFRYILILTVATSLFACGSHKDSTSEPSGTTESAPTELSTIAYTAPVNTVAQTGCDRSCLDQASAAGPAGTPTFELTINRCLTACLNSYHG